MTTSAVKSVFPPLEWHDQRLLAQNAKEGDVWWTSSDGKYRRVWGRKPRSACLNSVNQVKCVCAACGDTFWRRFPLNPRVKRDPVCSLKCVFTVSKKLTRTARITGSGYAYVDAPADHPRRGSNGRIREHILVAERTLGRYLTDDEHVHHIDMDKLNNNPENLSVVSDASHQSAHNSLDLCVAPLLNKGYIRFNRESGTYEVTGKLTRRAQRLSH